MKTTIIACLMMFILSITGLKGQTTDTATVKCKLCAYESMYFSEGSLVGQPKPGAMGKYYPYICTDGIWNQIYNQDNAKYYTEVSPTLNNQEKKVAEKCEACLYGNKLYSEGSEICMPKNDATPFTVYPYRCTKGKWVHQSSVACP